MAKRGETRPWRMRYRFEGQPVRTEAHATRARAEFRASQQRWRTGPDGQRCEAWVEHRDQPGVAV